MEPSKAVDVLTRVILRTIHRELILSGGVYTAADVVDALTLALAQVQAEQEDRLWQEEEA